jgi:hypothetical protein
MNSNPAGLDTRFVRNFNGEVAAINPVSASIAATNTVAVAVAVDPVRTVAVLDGLASLIRDHVKAINALGVKLKHAEAKVEQYQTAIGQHVKAIKLVSPDDWENIVRAECNLGRSRAYELLAIADGTKTVEQVRAAGAKRVREHEERKKISRPLANGQPADNAGDPEASAAEMRAKFAAIETAAYPKTAKQREPEAAQVYAAELEVTREPPNRVRATIYRTMKLGDAVMQRIKGTSLDSAREIDALVFLNRGAPEGGHTEDVKQLVAEAVAGKNVSAIECKKNGTSPPPGADIAPGGRASLALNDVEIGDLQDADAALKPSHERAARKLLNHFAAAPGEVQRHFLQLMRDDIGSDHDGNDGDELESSGCQEPADQQNKAREKSVDLKAIFRDFKLTDGLKAMSESWRLELEARVSEHLSASRLLDLLERRLERDGINVSLQLQKIRSASTTIRPRHST